MNAYISPTPIQRFVDSNGNALVGGQLFTYQAGTTTPVATYTDATGLVQNTNPIILNQRGEASIWLSPTQVYKFVLATATDTNPPQSPIWTEDNIQSSAPVAVGGMTDEHGSGGTPGFVASVDFVAGTTTQLTLSQNYGSAANLWVAFDAAEQGADQFSLSGTTLTFNSPIPAGTQKVFVKGGTALSIGTPGSGTVGDAQISSSSNLYAHVYSFVGSKDVGATGNGTTDDHVALQNAGSLASNAGKLLLVTPGTYLVGSSISFASPVDFMPGAQFVVKSGAVVTFNGKLTGPLTAIFSVQPGGNIVVNTATTAEGYPEWFGAQPGNNSFDCAPYINASLSVFPITRLQCTTYYTSATILMQKSGQSLLGGNPNLTQGGFQSTVITNQSAGNNILQIGANTNPYPGALQTSATVKNIVVARSTAPDMSQSSEAFRVQYVSGVLFEGVSSIDSKIAWHNIGSSYVRYTHCNAFKATAGINGTDTFMGWYLDGSQYIGFSDSGNPSILFTDCVCTNLIGANAWVTGNVYQGIVLQGQYGWSDVWIFDFETNVLGTGIILVGNGTSDSPSTRYNARVYIYNPILDTCAISGISFSNISLYGDIHVIGGYANFNFNTTAPAGLGYSASNGSIQVSSFMVDGASNHTSNAVNAYQSKGIVHRDCSYLEFFVTPLLLNNVTHSSFTDQVRNYSTNMGANSMCAQLNNGCSRNKFDLSFEGTPGYVEWGYNLVDSTTNFCEFSLSRMDATVLSSGNKIINNGVPVTAIGTFGTNNLASGIIN